MVKSKTYGFEVKILQKSNENKTSQDVTSTSYEPLREMASPMGIYTVATPNQEFIIELKSNDNRIYGARLYIDEQEIYYKKTFKSRGFFMGFKLGDGKFQAFKFAPPTYENRDSAPPQLTKSEIKVEFFKTTERLVSNQNILNKTIRKAQDSYTPGIVRENKKFFRKSLTVQAGEVLYKPGLEKSTLLKKLQDQKTQKFKENVIEYDNVLDTVIIHYGDFNSLLVQGVLSLANYDHLNVVPLVEIRQKPKIVERILMTIIRKYNTKGLSLPEIEHQFKTILRRNFEDLEVGPLVTFISLRHQMFQLDQLSNLKCSETAKNIYLDLRDTDPDTGIIPSHYFKTNAENELCHRKNDPKFMSYPGKENSRSHKPPITIDLTDD